MLRFVFQASLVQLVERRSPKPDVVGSIPTGRDLSNLVKTMDPSKISGGNWLPEKNPLNNSLKPKQEEKTTGKTPKGVKEGKEWGGLFELPSPKVVKRLTSLLEKTLSNPQVNQLVTEAKIPPYNQRAIALSTWSFLKQLFGKNLNLSSEEEKELLQYIEENYTEDSREEATDPDRQKKKKKEQKKSKRAKSPKVELVIKIIDKSLVRLFSENRTLSLES